MGFWFLAAGYGVVTSVAISYKVKAAPTEMYIQSRSRWTFFGGCGRILVLSRELRVGWWSISVRGCGGGAKGKRKYLVEGLSKGLSSSKFSAVSETPMPGGSNEFEDWYVSQSRRRAVLACNRSEFDIILEIKGIVNALNDCLKVHRVKCISIGPLHSSRS